MVTAIGFSRAVLYHNVYGKGVKPYEKKAEKTNIYRESIKMEPVDRR